MRNEAGVVPLERNSAAGPLRAALFERCAEPQDLTLNARDLPQRGLSCECIASLQKGFRATARTGHGAGDGAPDCRPKKARVGRDKAFGRYLARVGLAELSGSVAGAWRAKPVRGGAVNACIAPLPGDAVADAACMLVRHAGALQVIWAQLRTAAPW
jgi:hypothetical protein